MRNFEDELKIALRRQDPPGGFTDRVMARIPRTAPARQWRWDWLAVAAAASFAVIGGGAWEHQRRQVEGEIAKKQLIYALTVASESLQTTKELVTRY